MIFCEMKKEQLARRLARESHVSPAAAADQLDRIVSDLLTRVGAGRRLHCRDWERFNPEVRRNFNSTGRPPKTGAVTPRRGPSEKSRVRT